METLSPTLSKVKTSYETGKTYVGVLVKQNMWQAKGDSRNFTVHNMDNFECKVGRGSTEEKAIEDFKDWFEFFYDVVPIVRVVKRDMQ